MTTTKLNHKSGSSSIKMQRIIPTRQVLKQIPQIGSIIGAIQVRIRREALRFNIAIIEWEIQV